MCTTLGHDNNSPQRIDLSSGHAQLFQSFGDIQRIVGEQYRIVVHGRHNDSRDRYLSGTADFQFRPKRTLRLRETNK